MIIAIVIFPYNIYFRQQLQRLFCQAWMQNFNNKFYVHFTEKFLVIATKA